MKPYSTFLKWATMLGLVAWLPVSAIAAEKPVALIGPDFATRTFEALVLTPAGITAKSSTTPLPVEQYREYKTVVLLEQFRAQEKPEGAWNVGANSALIASYLAEGGKVVILGAAFPKNTEASGQSVRNLKSIDEFTGFAYYPNATLKNPVRVHHSGEALFGEGEKEWNLVAKYTVPVGRVSTAEVLASVHDDAEGEHPFATRKKHGAGVVYWLGTSPFRLRQETGPESETLKRYCDVLLKIVQE